MIQPLGTFWIIWMILLKAIEILGSNELREKVPWWFELREKYQGIEVLSVKDINMRGEVN